MKTRTLAVLVAAIACVANAPGPGEVTDFDRTVGALQVGASNQIKQDAKLRQAGRALAALGARPVETEDLAVAWGQESLASPLRGRALGPAYRRMVLEGRASIRLEQTFLAGQRAQIEVVAWDHARFQLEVTDDEGKHVCSATRLIKCTWLPAWTTRYRVSLANPGSSAGTYFLVLQ